MAGGGATQKTLYSFGWTVDELSQLNEDGCKLVVEISMLLDVLNEEDANLVGMNVAGRLSGLQDKLQAFIKGIIYIVHSNYYTTFSYLFLPVDVVRHQRIAATRVCGYDKPRAVQQKPYQCNKKPYALPVQCIPYSGMPEHQAWKIVNNVVLEMSKLGMEVAGKYMSKVHR